MNPIDPINHLSCTILGLKTALLEAEKENRSLQKLLLSFYVKDAAKETDLYKMNRTGVKMNVIFQKEKQDLNLKIQELESRLTDSESENVNLNFQVRELKAFLEEKTNLLELYNPKDAKPEKLLLNNLKERDLIQIFRNVLVCMKKGRVSRALHRSLKRQEQKKSRNLKKMKSEDTDVEMSDDEIDLMSTMIENRLKEDVSIKCERNESSGPQSVDEIFEIPTIELNENDITGAETNSSHGNAVGCISVDHSIFSPLSIADSDYSSNGIESVESLNSEKVPSTEISCTNVPSVEVIKPSFETNNLIAEEDAKPCCKTDILGSELNAVLGCETNILPQIGDLEPSCENDVLPASNSKTSISLEKDAELSCETNPMPSELNLDSSCETDVPLDELLEQPNCETNLLLVALDAELNCESSISCPERDTSDFVQKTVASCTEASVDFIQSDDSVIDPDEIPECDPFIDPKIVNSAADLILEEMIHISYSNEIIESFREFCKNDIHSESDQNTSDRIQITDDSLTSKSTSSNPSAQLAPHDVGHESIPVKRKINVSSQDDTKKIRLKEDVFNSAESTAVDFVLEENTNGDQVHSLGDETNRDSLKDQDKDTQDIIRPTILDDNIIEIDPKLEYRKTSVSNNTIHQEAYESDELLPDPATQSDIVFSRSNEIALDSNPCLETSAGESAVQSVYVEKESDSYVVQTEVTENTNQGVDPKNTNQMEDTEFISGEETIIKEVTSIREAGKDSLSILNEFTALEKEMRQRMTVFKEFLLQDDDYGEMEMADEMEYIVVAEILEDNNSEFSDREALIDDSSLPDDIVNSLHETSLKTVELQTSKENSSIQCENRLHAEEFCMPTFNSMTEENDSSDDEKDVLTIVEDNHVDDFVADSTFNGDIHKEENKSESVSANVSEKLVSNSRDAHSVLKKDQPIREITNIPRYNFRRSAAFTDSACKTSQSLYLPAENSVHPAECSHVSQASTVEESLKNVQMQFYVENQSSGSSPSLCISIFDEVWSQIKLNLCENSSSVNSDSTDFMPCRYSIMNLVFRYKDQNTDLNMQKEKVPGFPEVKKSLEEFLKEKIRNHALAFDNVSSTVCHADTKTLCCAIIEILLDTVASNNTRRHEIILRDFLNLSMKLESTIFQGFVDELKTNLKTKMWAKDWKVKENGNLVSDLRLLSKFFTRLCRLNDDAHSVISLLRETLFSFKFRGHPVAFSVLNEWPEIFPRDAQDRSLIDHIILFTLVNHKMDYNRDLYNIVEVQQLISNFFNFKLGMKTAEEYAKELMLQLSDPMWEDAIGLLCKRQMFPWTYSNVIMKYLLPILKKWKTEYFPEEILIKVLRALKTLLGSCPINSAENEMFKLDVIVKVLDEILSGHKGSSELKETVILALCDLSLYRFSLCVEILEHWKPDNGVIRRSTFQLLRDQLWKYRHNWHDFLFPPKNSRLSWGNKHRRMDGFRGVPNRSSSRSKNEHAVISVGVTQKMNKNRSIPNRLMQDNPIGNNKKKKKSSKKKRKRK